MKCIRTRYMGPTNSKGTRIVADDGDGNSVYLARDTARAVEEDMFAAAVALTNKMKWRGELRGGWHKQAMYWVFLD